MVPTLNREQSREVDRRAREEFGVSGLVLMENAGRGTAELLARLGAKGPVVICCGKGNNAGDGFVIARHLDLCRIGVRICLWASEDELRGDAAANFGIVRKSGLPVEVFGNRHDRQRLAEILAGADWVVDALLGTGAQGEPRSPLAEVIDQLNEQHLPILAVDLPSGLDCDTGTPSAHTIRARHTCTFVAVKTGFMASGAAGYTGEVHVVGIGAPRRLVDEVIGQANPGARGAF
jgi:NAD(P)H-hydrate epimerase